MTKFLDKARLFQKEGTWQIHFQAMASPCSVFMEGLPESQARALSVQILEEVKRIEQKYSRYREDSILSHINQQAGIPTPIDEETLGLLQLADILYQQSEGRFDITSGVLRKLWAFSKTHDTPLPIPSQQAIDGIMPFIGWDKIKLESKMLTLNQGMQIDFGGIGKEYAADRCAQIAKSQDYDHVLINLGGDVVATGKRANNELWQVGVEACWQQQSLWKTLPLGKGAIATSGDMYRNITHQGKRYSHILDARTGYPLEQHFCSITIAAPTATEAGMLTTLAILFADQGEAFLKAQGRPYWLQSE